MSRKKDRMEDELRCRSAAFDEFYHNIYADRWQTLKEAMLEEKENIAYSHNLLKPYFLDEASVLTASLLPLEDNYSVLDMCAAPGGKTLVIASRLDGRGTITANDRSRQRKARLDNVLDEHLDEKLRSCVRTTCHDASRWGLYEKDAYDAVLLDAPCSSERHVMESREHMAMWSANRPKRLAIEQYSLLASAFMAVKSGGYLLYSTCSINRGEDEEVIEKLFRKKAGLVEEIDVQVPFAEKRTHGSIILPDVSDGKGPMYFCLLRKTVNEQSCDSQM